MTNKRKLQIAGAALVAALILLLLKRGGALRAFGIAGDDDIPAPGGLIMPGGLNYIGSPITIPGLNFGGRNDLQMIGSCCMDCQKPSSATRYSYTGSTYVYNAGNSGPNIYNYSPPVAPSAPRDGLWSLSANRRVG